MDKIKCPLDISVSIGSNGQLKSPLDICMSNGSVGSNGPLDILPLPSHRPDTCMGSMPTYDVIQVNLFSVQSNVQWTYSCPLDPMDKSNVQWTCACPLDPMDNSNVHWTYCMSNGSIGSNGPLDILPLPSHRPATCMGSMPTYDVIQVNLLNGRRGVLQYITLYCILSGTDTTLCAWEAPF